MLSASYESADPVQIFTAAILVSLIGLAIALGGNSEGITTGLVERQGVALHQRETVRLELDALNRFEDGLVAPESAGRASVVGLVGRQQLLIDGGRPRAAARLERQIAILNEVIRNGSATVEFLAGVEQSRAALTSQLERLNEGG